MGGESILDFKFLLRGVEKLVSQQAHNLPRKPRGFKSHPRNHLTWAVNYR